MFIKLTEVWWADDDTEYTRDTWVNTDHIVRLSPGIYGDIKVIAHYTQVYTVLPADDISVKETPGDIFRLGRIQFKEYRKEGDPE